jgi:hypothetical protein
MYPSRRRIARLVRRAGLPYVRTARIDGLQVLDGERPDRCVVVTARCQYGDTIEAMGAEAKDEAEMSAAAEAAMLAAGYTVDRFDRSTFRVSGVRLNAVAPPKSA